FKSRLWFMQFHDTICSSCARGCNVVLGTRDDRVLRMVPRDNPDVNGPWMCDHGRLHYAFANDEGRLAAPRAGRRPTPSPCRGPPSCCRGRGRGGSPPSPRRS
ncbi:MAG: hypothetical protein ACE5JG_09620, partial [Planctomycetota bacterium]